MSGMMDTQTAEYWIETLRLRKHPEGGYYREVYRSNETVSSGALPPRFRGERNLATSIYFLLPGSEVSRLHRLSADEVWHFYTGSSITLYIFQVLINKTLNTIKFKREIMNCSLRDKLHIIR